MIEHQIMYESVESLYSTLETKLMLNINWNLNKNLKDTCMAEGKGEFHDHKNKGTHQPCVNNKWS